MIMTLITTVIIISLCYLGYKFKNYKQSIKNKCQSECTDCSCKKENI